MARAFTIWASPVLVTICLIIGAPFGLLYWLFDGLGTSLAKVASIRFDEGGVVTETDHDHDH
jgi:hypothetical protein